MKWKGWVMLAAVSSVSDVVGQGFLVVDQASGTLEEPIVNGSVIPQNSLAQSFTPSLSTVEFVQFRGLVTLAPAGRDVTMVVNLRQGAYNGPVMSSTEPVVITGFSPIETFYFPDQIPVTPSEIYFFETLLLSEGSLSIGTKAPSDYVGGDLFSNGVPSGGIADLWFREGTVVPEPSAFAVLGLGAAIAGTMLWQGRHRN